MGAERETPDVGEIGIQGDQEAALLTNMFPKSRIVRSRQPLVMNALSIIASVTKKCEMGTA